MAVKTRADLKAFFQTGDIPTQGNFEDLIDSFVHMTEGDDNEGQIKNTLHISSSENYISGSAPGITYVTPENEDFTKRNIETRTAFNSLGQANESDPADVGKDQNDFFTSSISPTSGSLAALFDRNLSNEFGTILYYGPTGSHTGSIEFSGDTADGASSDFVKTGFHVLDSVAVGGGPGDNDIKLFSDIGTNDGFTLSYWVKPLETGSLGNPMIALGTNYSDEGFAFGIHGPNIYFDVGDTIISSSAHGMEINRWYHWIIRGEGGIGTEILKAYRDGEEVFSGTYVAPSSHHKVYPLYYGGSNNQFPHPGPEVHDAWACQLSEVAIFNRSKSIEDLWDGSGNPVDLSGTNTETSASGLVLYHRLNEADVQSDGTIKDYGPYNYTASIGTGVSSLNWSNDAAGPSSVSIDFYHRGHSFNQITGESNLTNAIEVQFIKGFEAQQIQISGSNNGGNSFDPLYGDTENVFHGQSNDYGFDLAPFAYIQADVDVNGLGTAVYRRIRFNTTTVYKHYRITYRNWQNQILKPSELAFGSSSGYFVSGNIIPEDSTVPMAIASSGSIIPGKDNAYDLGAPDKIWRHLYVGSGSINFMSRSFDTEENEFINEKVAQLTVSKSGGANAGEFLQFKGRKGDDHMDVEFRQVQAGKDPLRGHILNDAAGPSSTDVYGKMQQYMGGGDGQQLITRPEYTAFSPFGRKFVSHILNAQGRGSLTIGLQNFTGDQKGFFRVEKNTSIAGAGTPLFEVSESGQTILYGTDSELTAEGGISVRGQFSGSVAALRGGNTVIEDGVISQPGTISQSFSIGTLTSPSTTTLTGVGSNCIIRISEDSIVTVNDESEFKIQCPQPDITANSDTGTITLSDPNVMGGGDIIFNPNNGGNPSLIKQNTTIPENHVAYWTENNVPGTYINLTPPGLTATGIQIGADRSVPRDGITVDGVVISPAYGNLGTFDTILKVDEGAKLYIQPQTQVTPVKGGTNIDGQTTFTNNLTVGTNTVTLSPSGHITASGNISASGNLYADRVYVEDKFLALDSAGNLGTNANIFAASITASGNISSSGDIIATGDLEVGNLIKSRDSATGTLHTVVATSVGAISMGGSTGPNPDDNISINSQKLILRGDTNITLQSSIITASGNISASGNILANNITASGNIKSSNDIIANRFKTLGTQSIYLNNASGPATHSFRTSDDNHIFIQIQKELTSKNHGIEFFNNEEEIKRFIFANGGSSDQLQYSGSGGGDTSHNFHGNVITPGLSLVSASSAAATDASHYSINGKRVEVRSQLQSGIAVDTGWTLELRNTSIAANSLIVANVIGGEGAIITGSVVSANVVAANTASLNFYNIGEAIAEFTASIAVF